MTNYLPNGTTWHDVNPAFFSQIPYLSVALMEKFRKDDDIELTLLAAAGALQGLVVYGLDDYNEYLLKLMQVSNKHIEKIKLPPKVEGFDGPKYKYIPNRNAVGSTKLHATLTLISMLEKDAEKAKPIIIDLVKNPEIAAKFPNTVRALQTALERAGKG